MEERKIWEKVKKTLAVCVSLCAASYCMVHILRAGGLEGQTGVMVAAGLLLVAWITLYLFCLCCFVYDRKSAGVSFGKTVLVFLGFLVWMIFGIRDGDFLTDYFTCLGRFGGSLNDLVLILTTLFVLFLGITLCLYQKDSYLQEGVLPGVLILFVVIAGGFSRGMGDSFHQGFLYRFVPFLAMGLVYGIRYVILLRGFDAFVEKRTLLLLLCKYASGMVLCSMFFYNLKLMIVLAVSGVFSATLECGLLGRSEAFERQIAAVFRR